MKSVPEYMKLAREKLHVGKHITTITFPSLQDPKLLLAALQHLFLSMNYCMNAILTKEQDRGKIPPFNPSFNSRFTAFRMNCADRLGFDKTAVKSLWDSRHLLLEHKKSPVEFVRDKRLVICSDDFDMTIISADRVKELLKLTINFVEHTQEVIEEPTTKTTVTN